MSAARDLQLRVGGRLWLDGQGWEIAEITGSTVRLIAGDQLTAAFGVIDQLGEGGVR